MSGSVRVARDDAERVASIEIALEAFDLPGPLWLQQAKRLASLLRSRAAWWVAERGGRLVGATLAYPLRFADPQGVLHAGYGIGTLVVRKDARRGGVARALVEAAGDGAGIGLLYSAIPSAYYEGLGFRIVPGWNLVCTDPAALAASGTHTALRPIDPRREAGLLSQAWDRGHPGLRLHRDDAAWHTSFAENQSDLYLAAGEGYVRLRRNPEDLEVVELFGAPPAPTLRAVAALAAELAIHLRGWFDPVPELAAFFEDRGRAKTLPMVHRWDEPMSCRFWSSDYF